MGWLTDWLLPAPPDVARANCRGRGIEAYQATLIPGDIAYRCTTCGGDLLGGAFGMGWCSCGARP